MPIDAITAVRPLTDFVELVDVPLIDFLPIDGSSVVGNILVSDVWTHLDEGHFTLGAEFYLGGIENLHLPGLDQLSLSFNEDALAKGLLVVGEEPSLHLKDVGITLRVSPDILRAEDGNGATVTTKCEVRFDRNGFHFLAFDETSIANSRIAGTDIAISLDGIHFDDKSDAFLSVRSGTLTLPMFTDAKGSSLVLKGKDLSFGREGPSGNFKRVDGEALSFSLGGFACEIEEASFSLVDGQFTDVILDGRIDLRDFLKAGRSDGWVRVSFSIGPEGLVASLSDDEPIVSMNVPEMFHLSADSIRLEADDAGAGAVLWLSGTLTPDIRDVEGGWPSFDFDEIGIGPQGTLRLGSGASVATTQPFVLNWNFLKLTVTAFSLQRPDDAPEALELRITAAVEVVSGVPAGASVDGLVVRRSRDGAISARFDGIGVSFGTPGGYSFAASLSWDGSRQALSGTGYLDVSSLDIRLDVVAAASREKAADGRTQVTTFFLAAEATLVPGGIPIGTTGLSLYGVSGLLAHNLTLKLTSNSPRRYFDAFEAHPAGSFAALSKWEVSEAKHALSLGVLVGTADDGWLFSARGALMISIPDLAILLTATGNLIRERQAMNSGAPGMLSALLAAYPAQKLLRLDFSAQWESGSLFEVQGAGGGEFYGDKPADFRVWLGEKSAPVAARALKLDSTWLLNSEYWFGIDARRKAEIGLLSRFDLRGGIDGLYAEMSGYASANMTLAWRPSQFEGGLVAHGRARLVAGRLSLGFSQTADVNAQIARPTLFEIALRSCIKINLGIRRLELCLAHSFRWRKNTQPELPSLVQGLSIVPRHWTPRINSSLESPINNGIAHHVSSEASRDIDLGEVAPHSELVLELSKSMFVEPDVSKNVCLNDGATPYLQKIGEKSGWLARWSITELALRDDTEGKAFALFGTFSRSPLDREKDGKAVLARPPNTELRLLSSRRFGQGGSIGGGGAEETPSRNCTPKEDTVKRCVSLLGIEIGSGLLPNGWPYHLVWRSEPDSYDSRHGILLEGESEFFFWPPEGVASVEVVMAIPGQPPAACEPPCADTIHTHYPAPIRLTARERVLQSLCWDELIADDGSGEYQNWRGSSGCEEWTLEAKRRLLVPGHKYALTVKTLGQLQKGTGTVGNPMSMQRTYRFKAGRAPDWRGGLSRAIACHYPDDGQRPVYRGYDLRIRFKDDFFNALYALDKRRLGVRLRSTDGKTVASPNGDVFLPKNWEAGPVIRSPAEEWWIRSRAGDSGEPCETGANPPNQREDVYLPITLSELKLRPQARYVVELVAVDAGEEPTNPTEPLAEWSFTTSRFETFQDMMKPPTKAPAVGLAMTQWPSDSDFRTLARALGVPDVSMVEYAQITPVRAGSHLSCLLIEAPEPLDDKTNRLSVRVGDLLAKCVFNLDKTRAIAALEGTIELSSPDQTVDVSLQWARAPAGAAREEQRSVGGNVDCETVTWRVPLKGLF